MDITKEQAAKMTIPSVFIETTAITTIIKEALTPK
jgi:hypothetical protein